jgi:hypothetical protein
MEQRIENLGRTIGSGRGDSPHYRHNDVILHE